MSMLLNHKFHRGLISIDFMSIPIHKFKTTTKCMIYMFQCQDHIHEMMSTDFPNFVNIGFMNQKHQIVVMQMKVHVDVRYI